MTMNSSMEKLQIMKGVSSRAGSCVITIGNFDGVHEGHRVLFATALEKARQLQLPAGVFTFHPHPAQIIRPDRPFLRLFSYEDQRQLVQNFGFQFLIEEPFTSELSRLRAEDFFEKYILAPLNPKVIVVGYDFGFGSNREGSIEVLKNRLYFIPL